MHSRPSRSKLRIPDFCLNQRPLSATWYLEVVNCLVDPLLEVIDAVLQFAMGARTGKACECA
jgi:hypothetical protein